MRSKYSNQFEVVDGIKFRSRAEARRYSELKLLERADEITRLQLQPKFPIICGALVVGAYMADFQYYDRKTESMVIEDVKGMKTALYKFKRRCVEAQYGIKIAEVRA